MKTKYSYTYLKGILTFISSAYLPRTSQGACSFTKMMSLFVRDDCKRRRKQPPRLTFSGKKERNHRRWSVFSLVLCHPSHFLILPQAHGALSGFYQLIFLLVSFWFSLWLPSGLYTHSLTLSSFLWVICSV